MLIRSQDKRMIANFDNICTVSAFSEKDSEDIYIEDGTGSLMVGRYSTKAKALKVLDMSDVLSRNGTNYRMLALLLSGISNQHPKDARCSKDE